MTPHRFNRHIATVIAFFTLMVCTFGAFSVHAHGLLVSVRGDGQAVTGTVYYSNGEPGAGEWVQLFDRTDPKAPTLSMNAGEDGSFRFKGIEGHVYRVTVTGEEGHVVDSDITLAPDARGKFVETQSKALVPTSDGLPLPPAWALLGGLLLISMLVAMGLRMRRWHGQVADRT